MLRFWWIPGAVTLAILAAGPLLAGRLVSSFTGWKISLAAIALGLAWGAGAGLIGVIGLFRRSTSARRLLASAALPLLFGLGGFAALELPSDADSPLTDVTTDLASPPPFLGGPAMDQPYPAAYQAIQAASHGDLAPLYFKVSAQLSYDAALAVAGGMPGWTVIRSDRASGMIQIVARTVLFRFEDDVAIRVRPAAGRSIVDIRSRSRVGTGDRGVNAERIRQYRAALIARLATL